MTFQSTVMTIAIFCLIVSLCFIGLALYKEKHNSTFPPVIANCPDYWESGKDANGNNVCISRPGLGNQSAGCTGEIDFSQWGAGAEPGRENCQKYEWAKTCNLTWDGITNVDETCV